MGRSHAARLMITRSYDPVLAEKFFEMVPENEGIDWRDWLDNLKNVMLIEGENCGLATFEYPGMYNVHWFFTVRGKKALNLAREMLDHLFSNFTVHAIRGITPEYMKGARFLARQVGLKSYGWITYRNVPCELLCMTKEEFYGLANRHT